MDTTGTTSTITYVTADQLGTPRAIANSSGTTEWQNPYQGNPWNEVAPTSNGYTYNLRAPGQYFDVETGLNYNVNRDYDSATGRYLESDPVGLAAGVSTYAYVNGSPLQHTDALGLFVCSGSLVQCNDFVDALQSVQAASTSSNINSDEQQDLANIVSAYGASGDPNVTIQFGSLPSCVPGSTETTGSGCEIVTLDSSQILDPLNPADAWGSVVAHEGQHVADDMEGAATGYAVSTNDTEVNAYTSQAYYDQAMQYVETSGYGALWTPQTGINWNVIQSRASFSTQQDGAATH